MDVGNILRQVYDNNTQSLNVNLQGSGSVTLPNISRLSDGTNFITSSNIGSKVGLDVAIVNMPEILINDADDSIKIGNGSGTYMAVNTDGSTNTTINNAIVPYKFDSIFPTYPNATTEIYQYKNAGATVATVTVIYSDSTKNFINSIVRT